MSITNTAGVLIQGVQTGHEIFDTVLNAMDAAEKEKQSGADKKAWVLAFIESFIKDIGENWLKWAKVIISFIDLAKSFYNQCK